MIDRTVGAVTEPGLFPVLEEHFGAGSFDRGRTDFTTFGQRGDFDTWTHFTRAWDGLVATIEAHHGPGFGFGPLQDEAYHAGSSGPQRRLQHAITSQFEEVQRAALHDVFRTMPRCPERDAWFGADRFSPQFLTGWPSETHDPREFGEMLTFYLGAPSPALHSGGHVGASIPTTDAGLQVCDAHGTCLRRCHLPVLSLIHI